VASLDLDPTLHSSFFVLFCVFGSGIACCSGCLLRFISEAPKIILSPLMSFLG